MKAKHIYHSPISWGAVLSVTIPTIFMALIQASYSMIDGMFISNLLGSQALSSLTLISPYFNLFIAIGAMFASGGSAVVMKQIGEGRQQEAKSNFTMLTIIAFFVGFLFSCIFLCFTTPLVSIFHTTPDIRELCREYLFSYSFFIIPQILFSVLQIYTIGCGHSTLAMTSSLIGGIINLVFDFLMIKIWKLGMTGAAVASGLGMLFPCLMLLKNFTRRDHMLHFIRPSFDQKTLLKTMTNGSSEFASNLVSGVVIMLFNSRMLSLAGANGVAASTITFYVFGFMSAIYMGYMLGVSPLLSYFYGAGETRKLKKIRTISLTFILILSVTTTLLSISGSELLVSVFTPEKSDAWNLAINGNRLFSIALLFVGFNTFSSMMFTALSNGKTSAVIAFSRTFFFLSASIILLPMVWGINGLWMAVPVSEFLALLLSGYFIKKHGPL